MHDRRDWQRMVAFGLCLMSALALAWVCSNAWAWLQAAQKARGVARTAEGACEQTQQLAYLLESEFRQLDTRLDNLENLVSAIARGEERVLRHFKLELVPLFPLRRPEGGNPDPWELLSCPKTP